MPSIEAVEQFKTIVQGLARESEIRAELGLPPEEILPPESALDTDLADLLGGMPSGDSEPSTPDTESGPDEAVPEAESSDLDDLFAAVPDAGEEPSGPSLDDLLGPAPDAPDEPGEPDLAATPDLDPFADILDSPPAEAVPDDLFGEPEPLEAEPFAEGLDAPLEPEAEPELMDDFSLGDLEP